MIKKWIDIEDELLKISVLKFGLNKWEKISSGIHKKNSWDCKKRWYEWVDYRIKKINWTIEEDEKLFYIHEAFKMNWRIISYFLRRNSLQCLVRFKVLFWSKKSRKSYLETGDVFFPQTTQIFEKMNFKKKKRYLINETSQKIFEFKIRLLNLQGKKKLTRIFKKSKEIRPRKNNSRNFTYPLKKKELKSKRFFKKLPNFFLWHKNLCLKKF